MITYYIISGNIIDVVSNDLAKIRAKFPNEKIYQTNKPIKSIYIK
jgi:hypothetical protein